ncbi:MAG: DUF445 domain-containing protein [Methylovulum sp.]|nr:DUF445 domain-containing protein [Methylovulum sp.]
MKTYLNNSFVTNAVAALIIVIGYSCPLQQELVKSVGFFALSGAITNWLAVYMLFEKVPYLYGSGVIPERFEDFKQSIKHLMMEQFFTADNIGKFIETEERQEGGDLLNLEPLLNAVNYDKIYEGLVSSIMESSFGGMLLMMGGAEALAPLKEPFSDKMRATLTDTVHSDVFKNALHQGLDTRKISADIVLKIESVIDKRLGELTPQLVKEMVQRIISEHLGWLVVWGGVVGGLLGALFGFA